MRLNETAFRPLRQPPADATTKNHELLVQGAYVDQLMAGVYTYLPLGLRTLNKLSAIVRQEMNKIGGEELLMPLLHPREIWETSGGWKNIDVLFKVPRRTDKSGKPDEVASYALAQSEEEVVTPLFFKTVLSTNWMNRVRKPYNIQWKFRDELRSKSGVMRGREFLMKDMYSFHENQEDFDRFYEQVKQAYLAVFARMDLVAKATEASGGSFTDKISYEFMVLTEAGEDDILYSEQTDYAINQEITKLRAGDLAPDGSALAAAKASEVGNVFDLGQKYSKAFDIMVETSDNKRIHPIMGCYGIGISRLLGVLVEKHHDQQGIIWPESVAPYPVHLVTIGSTKQVTDAADALYQSINQNAVYDDRNEGPGVKFADADLLGMPLRVTISERTLASDSAEVKPRNSDQTELVKLADLPKRLA